MTPAGRNFPEISLGFVKRINVLSKAQKCCVIQLLGYTDSALLSRVQWCFVMCLSSAIFSIQVHAVAKFVRNKNFQRKARSKVQWTYSIQYQKHLQYNTTSSSTPHFSSTKTMYRHVQVPVKLFGLQKYILSVTNDQGWCWHFYSAKARKHSVALTGARMDCQFLAVLTQMDRYCMIHMEYRESEVAEHEIAFNSRKNQREGAAATPLWCQWFCGVAAFLLNTILYI